MSDITLKQPFFLWKGLRVIYSFSVFYHVPLRVMLLQCKEHSNTLLEHIFSSQMFFSIVTIASYVFSPAMSKSHAHENLHQQRSLSVFHSCYDCITARRTGRCCPCSPSFIAQATAKQALKIRFIFFLPKMC